MEQKLCLIVCSNFFPEVNQIIKSGNYSDVVIKCFHSNCTEAFLTNEKLKDITVEMNALYSKVIVIESSCSLENKINKEENNQIEIVRLNKCFQLLASESLLDHLICKKCYLVSNGWLINYKKHIKDWGFDSVTAKKFFNESTEKIVLLETGLEGDYLNQLEATADFMGLPYEILPVGLSYCKLFLDSIIFHWREENQRNTFNEKLASAFTRAADYTLAFNQLNTLIDLVDEEEIVNRIFNFLNILFLPSNIVYTPGNNKLKLSPLYFKQISSDKSEHIDKSFNIELWNQKELIGVFEIIEVALPQYIVKYKEISQIIGSFGGLAISNARKFMTIKNDELQILDINEKLRLSKEVIEENLFQQNILVEELTAAKTKLEKHQNHLEELVKERTKELENANEYLKKVLDKEKELSDLKSRFIAITSHEFRTPLTSILSSTQLLQRFNLNWDNEKKNVHYNRIISSVEYLTNLLNDILTLNRAESGMISYSPTNIDLNNFAKACIIDVEQLFNEKHVFNYRYKLRRKEFLLDPKLLKFIFNNLLSNAAKYSPDGGIIELLISKDKKSLVIEVSDEGIGIAEEDAAKIFDSFYRTKSSEIFAGNGLGLTIVKSAVEMHGGEIKVESVLGKGTKFTVFIPIVSGT